MTENTDSVYTPAPTDPALSFFAFHEDVDHRVERAWNVSAALGIAPATSWMPGEKEGALPHSFAVAAITCRTCRCPRYRGR